MSKLVGKMLQPIWRITRGTTLGAQGIVQRDNEILLVRHGYRSGWHFPGGGVEHSEPVKHALARELEEEVGVLLTGEPALHGVFANFKAFPGDHILVYVIEQWTQPDIPAPNAEIREQRFFSVSDLPDDVNAGARRRINELYFGAEPSVTW